MLENSDKYETLHMVRIFVHKLNKAWINIELKYNLLKMFTVMTWLNR